MKFLDQPVLFHLEAIYLPTLSHSDIVFLKTRLALLFLTIVQLIGVQNLVARRFSTETTNRAEPFDTKFLSSNELQRS